ncbi:histidine-tRNA ligase [Cavenderia fasciculata]|uniref:histidine--tRNA ligase n=1 Tax=Cavenderia fasciculata TaxID=261658 RepID=F4PSK0_CACFS|nr:histidine-tRNA ligase [Cavenderia fasciculata]EGG20692.1 histidine-tRNA ligase [Cavenderia fasciculata]|eukprot:XP_004358542.1 histidine-tRNA ligase [Cavenderia fasciculata]
MSTSTTDNKSVEDTTQQLEGLTTTTTTATAKPAAAAVPEKKHKEKKESKKKFVLKTPKGTQDYTPPQMAIREELFNNIKSCFKKHGAVTIETPVFELKDTLTGKYGEDSKLIYDLQDQGGEICSLRYDLTVPFARYVAMHGIRSIKRYHIARVYRRDNPVMTKGRFREFYQCDFDIAGEYDLMVPDAECVMLMCEILESVKVGNFVIKLNHRKLLDAIFAICGVPADKFRTICSAVDKLDKMSWELVRKEMVEEKGLDGEVADRIEKFVKLNGHPRTLMAQIRAEKLCDGHKDAIATLDQLDVLFTYLEAMGCLDRVSFDLSLARGLDYYTGIIYEAIITESDRGSVAAGGRYDGLVGMYGNTEVPSVGFSIGVERLFSILEEEAAKKKIKIRQNQTEVYVCQMDRDINITERLKIIAELWKAGINTEYMYRATPQPKKQIEAASDAQVPVMVLIGKTELETNSVAVKNMATKQQEVVERSQLVAKVQEILKSIDQSQISNLFK